jgi:hypothetical protein
MDIPILLELYKKKDPKRKRALFELFDSTIKLEASLAFIADRINENLGTESLITTNDVKYCRFYFGDIKSKIQVKDKPKIANNLKSNTITKEAIEWSDPDSVDSENKQVKSKFSK